MRLARQFRRLIPRFSLSNLLMLMVVVGLSLAWYDQRRKLGEQAEVIEKQRRDALKLTLNNIVRGPGPEDEKAQQIQVYAPLGAELPEWLGDASRGPEHAVGYPGPIHRRCSPGCDFIAECYDGRVVAFGYWRPFTDVDGTIWGYGYCRIASTDLAALPLTTKGFRVRASQ